MYIKTGQFASAFGAVPREYRNVLSSLEDKAQPRPYEVIRQVLIEELGPGAEGLFTSFDQKATAAASLAQVGVIHAGALFAHGSLSGLGAVGGCSVQELHAAAMGAEAVRIRGRCLSWEQPWGVQRQQRQRTWVLQQLDLPQGSSTHGGQVRACWEGGKAEHVEGCGIPESLCRH